MDDYEPVHGNFINEGGEEAAAAMDGAMAEQDDNYQPVDMEAGMDAAMEAATTAEEATTATERRPIVFNSAIAEEKKRTINLMSTMLGKLYGV